MHNLTTFFFGKNVDPAYVRFLQKFLMKNKIYDDFNRAYIRQLNLESTAGDNRLKTFHKNCFSRVFNYMFLWSMNPETGWSNWNASWNTEFLEEFVAHYYIKNLGYGNFYAISSTPGFEDGSFFIISENEIRLDLLYTMDLPSAKQDMEIITLKKNLFERKLKEYRRNKGF